MAEKHKYYKSIYQYQPDHQKSTSTVNAYINTKAFHTDLTTHNMITHRHLHTHTHTHLYPPPPPLPPPHLHTHTAEEAAAAGSPGSRMLSGPPPPTHGVNFRVWGEGSADEVYFKAGFKRWSREM